MNPYILNLSEQKPPIGVIRWAVLLCNCVLVLLGEMLLFALLSKEANDILRVMMPMKLPRSSTTGMKFCFIALLISSSMDTVIRTGGY